MTLPETCEILLTCMSENWFLQRCLNMLVGAVENYPPGGLTVHKYRGCWWVLWDIPLWNIPFGLEVDNPVDLNIALRGISSVGTPLTFETHVLPL